MRRTIICLLALLILIVPLGMTVASADDASAPIIYNLTPKLNSTIGSTTPTISANFTDPDGIDVGSVRIIVDNMDVTNWEETRIASDGFVYSVPSILHLSTGNHNVTVTVADSLGNKATSEWTFKVDPNYHEGGNQGGVGVSQIIAYSLFFMLLIGVVFLVYIFYLRVIRKYSWRKYFAQHPVHKHYLLFYGPIIGMLVFLLIAFYYISDGAFSSPWAYEITFVIAFCIGMTPFAIGARLERRMISKYEYAFSQFLFELADAIRGGIDPAKAIVEFSKVNTGVMRKPLTIAADGIKLGRPFEEMMLLMTKKMNSGLISRYASLIGEASKLGGDISVVIHRAAKDMDDMIRIENERRRQISMQATTIYISFAVLLIVIYLLIDMYPSIGSLDLGLIGGGLQNKAAQIVPRMSLELVIRRFFDLVLVNAICAGLLIGLFSEGQLKYGLLHAIIMVIASTVFFAVMVF